MSVQHTCDYCGEPIADQYPVRLQARGEPGGRFIFMPELGHYHQTEDQPCLAELLDRIALIHAVSSDLGPDREAIEQRIRARAGRQAEKEAQDERWRAHRERERAWRQTPREARERMLLDAIADERLTLSDVAERMSAALGAGAGDVPVLHVSGIRTLAMSMLAAGQLERVAETFRNKTRYRWQRRRDLDGPIADLERAYRDDEREVA